MAALEKAQTELEKARVEAEKTRVEADKAHLVLIDEAGCFLNPLVRRSWARRGKTPVLDSWGRHRDKVSVIGAVTLSSVARRPGFYFATRRLTL